MKAHFRRLADKIPRIIKNNNPHCLIRPEGLWRKSGLRQACPTFTGSTEGRYTQHLWLQLVCLAEPSSILPFHAHTGFPLEPPEEARTFCL